LELDPKYPQILRTGYFESKKLSNTPLGPR
jgi:hypothetical protein